MLRAGVIVFLSIIALTTAEKCRITDSNHHRFQKMFTEGLRSLDLQTYYYSARDSTYLTDIEETLVCKRLEKLHAVSKLNNSEKNFYLVGAHTYLECTNALPIKVLSAIRTPLSVETSAADELYFHYFANQLIGNTIDNSTKTKIVTRLHTILSADQSFDKYLYNVGYALNLAAEFGPMASKLQKWADAIVAQADEVDGVFLQYEGGLDITSLVINGLLKYSKALQTEFPLTDTQAQKFIAYFLSRRSVQRVKGASAVLEVLETIADHDENAICIEFFNSGVVHPYNPYVLVRLVDVLNRPIKKATVKTFHAHVLSSADGSPLSSKLELASKSSDNSVHELDLTLLVLPYGPYNIEMSYNSLKILLPIKVLSEVRVEKIEIFTGVPVSENGLRAHTMKYKEMLPFIITLDQNQDTWLTIWLVDEMSRKPITVHQAFVLFKHKESKKEVMFICERDPLNNSYKFSLDMRTYGGFFRYISGLYSYELIIGDAWISNSFRWHLADVELKFPKPIYLIPEMAPRGLMPEITHEFRRPEDRPPRLISDIFTVLTAMPLIVLFYFWNSMGVNVSHFKYSVSIFGFFFCFGSILVLFAMLWYDLNMYETLRVLGPLLIVTFLFGNRFLQSVARREQEQTQ